jgi:hypothetical protein
MDENMNSYLKRGLLALIAMCALSAQAQWQWIDANGRKVFSDKAPPAGTPESKILKRPGQLGSLPAAKEQSSQQETATSTANASSKTELDKAARDLKAREEQAEQAFRERERQTIAQNCLQARRSLSTLSAGTRISTVNDKGEPDFMGDDQRAAETQRLQGYIATNCQ